MEAPPSEAGTAVRAWRDEPPLLSMRFDFQSGDLQVHAGVAGERLPLQIPLAELDELVCGAWVVDDSATALRVLLRLRNGQTLRLACRGRSEQSGPELTLDTVRLHHRSAQVQRKLPYPATMLHATSAPSGVHHDVGQGVRNALRASTETRRLRRRTLRPCGLLTTWLLSLPLQATPRPAALAGMKLARGPFDQARLQRRDASQGRGCWSSCKNKMQKTIGGPRLASERMKHCKEATHSLRGLSFSNGCGTAATDRRSCRL